MDNNGRIMKELKELQEAKKTVSLPPLEHFACGEYIMLI